MMTLKKIKKWAERFFVPDESARRQFGFYQQLLREDRKCLRLITRFEEIVHGPVIVDWLQISRLVQNIADAVGQLIDCPEQMRPGAYPDLLPAYNRICRETFYLIPHYRGKKIPPYVLTLKQASEYPRQVGNKAYSLARIIRETAVSVPPGFVVTVNAYHSYLEENNLHGFIGKQLKTLNLQRPQHLQKAASKMRRAILEGTVPPKIKEGILSVMENMKAETAFRTMAVRSSARGEDGEVSFSGQFETVLDVSFEDILNAYKTVLAGKFSVRALTYRLYNGISDAETPMAVLFIPMIDARTSGVVYTLDPMDMCEGACLAIFAVTGPGSRLVDGTTNPDVFLISRHDPTSFLARHPAVENNPSSSQNGVQNKSKNLCLDDQSATVLAKWGLELESLNKAPQDIEWVQDQNNKLFVLQSRPIPGARGLPKLQELTQPSGAKLKKTNLYALDSAPPVPENHDSLLLKTGSPVSKGVASGAVYFLTDDAQMEDVPENAVLLTRRIPPSLASIINRVSAIIAREGSKVGHFASVAREFGLPVVVGTGDMSDCLQPGQMVTVDAYRGAVYEGTVEELISWNKQQQTELTPPFQKKLKPLLPLISSLKLTDPSLSDFSPQNCRSFHDLVRYVHEKGTQEMFSLVNTDGPGMRKTKPLETDIPIVMHVLDLDRGLAENARNLKSVTPEHFESLPMKAVWAGLTDADISWPKGLIHMDWERFDKVSGGIMSLKSSFLGSYALLAKHYAHLLLRFGYHFAVLDTLSGKRAEENYIQFRFKGGGGTPEKKMWRLDMIDRVLKDFDFRISIREDMLEAECKRLSRNATEFRLNVLGYLLGYTPLADMAFDSREHALEMAESILNKWRMKESIP